MMIMTTMIMIAAESKMTGTSANVAIAGVLVPAARIVHQDDAVNTVTMVGIVIMIATVVAAVMNTTTGTVAAVMMVMTMTMAMGIMIMMAAAIVRVTTIDEIIVIAKGAMTMIVVMATTGMQRT